jgi:hypothetical protein
MLDSCYTVDSGMSGYPVSGVESIFSIVGSILFGWLRASFRKGHEDVMNGQRLSEKE